MKLLNIITLESGKLYEGKEDARAILKKMGVSEADIRKVFFESEKSESSKKPIQMSGAPKGSTKYSVDGEEYIVPDNEVSGFLEVMGE